MDPSQESGVPRHLEGTLKGIAEAANSCKTTCDGFHDWLINCVNHSDGGRTNLPDSAPWEKGAIAAFQIRIQSFGAALGVAAGFARLYAAPVPLFVFRIEQRKSIDKCYSESITEKTKDVQKLESAAKKTAENISGQMQGLVIATEVIVTQLGASNHQPASSTVALIQAMERQIETLSSSLATCLSVLKVLEATPSITGNNVILAEALDDAKQLVGVIGHVQVGGPTVLIDRLVAKDRAKQVGGVISNEGALKFLSDSSF